MASFRNQEAIFMLCNVYTYQRAVSYFASTYPHSLSQVSTFTL